jgi:cephalosporin hydroxylase
MSIFPPIPNELERIEAMMADPEVHELRSRLMSLIVKYKYSYNWTWYGRPIIQLPQDVMATQMLLFALSPDVVVETGIAHGGSLILHASILELLGKGRVIGVDIDIRAHNRAAIEAHPLAKRIQMIQGSSIAPEIVEQVRASVGDAATVLVILDSNHTHDHVLAELDAYSPLVTPGSYLAVFDTIIEDLPRTDFPDRPWGPGNSPKSAVHAFLKRDDRFVIDREFESRLLLTVAPDGFLRRVK